MYIHTYVIIAQPYFGKLFGNIKRLEFSEEKVSPPIIAMVSAEDERIKITRYAIRNKLRALNTIITSRKCFARGSPEQWLTSFEDAMKNTVKDMLKTGMQSYSKEGRHQWTLTNPGQVVLTVVSQHVGV